MISTMDEKINISFICACNVLKNNLEIKNSYLRFDWRSTGHYVYKQARHDRDHVDEMFEFWGLVFGTPNTASNSTL